MQYLHDLYYGATNMSAESTYSLGQVVSEDEESLRVSRSETGKLLQGQKIKPTTEQIKLVYLRGIFVFLLVIVVLGAVAQRIYSVYVLVPITSVATLGLLDSLEDEDWTRVVLAGGGDTGARRTGGIDGRGDLPLQPFQKNLWSYWHTGEEHAEPLVRACLRSFHSKNPEWSVHVLQESDLEKFLSQPEILAFKEVKDASGLPAAADLLRLLLVWKYGGVWLDASSMFTTDNALDKLLEGRGVIEEENNVVKRAGLVTHLPAFSVEGKTTSVAPGIENWFISARPHSLFVGLWLQKFILLQSQRMKTQALWYNFFGGIIGSFINLYAYYTEFQKKGFFYGTSLLWSFGDYLTMHWAILYLEQAEKLRWMEAMWDARHSFSFVVPSGGVGNSAIPSREIVGYVGLKGVPQVEERSSIPRSDDAVLDRIIRGPQWPWPLPEVDKTKEEYFQRLEGTNPALELSLKIEIIIATVGQEPFENDPLLHYPCCGRRYFQNNKNIKTPRYFFKMTRGERNVIGFEKKWFGRKVEEGSVLDTLGLKDELNGD